jgi:hypothetical protein
MGRLEVNAPVGCRIEPAIRQPSARKDQSMRSNSIDDRQLKVAVEGRACYRSPNHCVACTELAPLRNYVIPLRWSGASPCRRFVASILLLPQFLVEQPLNTATFRLINGTLKHFSEVFDVLSSNEMFHRLGSRTAPIMRQPYVAYKTYSLVNGSIKWRSIPA